MLAKKILEQNDPVENIKDLMREWGKARKYNYTREHGHKVQSWILQTGWGRDKEYVPPMINADQCAVIDSVMIALFNDDKQSWRAVKCYYTKLGKWPHERVAKAMCCRKEEVRPLLDYAYQFIAQRYAQKARELGVRG